MSVRDASVVFGLLSLCMLVLFWGITSEKTVSAPTRPSAFIPLEKRDEVRIPLSNEKHGNAPTSPAEGSTSLVTRVVDGDTFIINGGQSVRMIGINTPELHTPNDSFKECYSEEATTRTNELILHKEVRLVKDVSNTDKYGRLLRYVYSDDGFINRILVDEGYAKARAYPPDTTHHTELLGTMNDAKRFKRGMWNECE